MPILPNLNYRPPSRLGNGQSPNGLAIQSAADYTVSQDRNALGVVAGVGALGALDLFDTVASSIPGLSSALDVKRGDVNRDVLQSLDMPGLADFYNDYQGGIEAVSGVYGIVASDIVARRLTGPASAFTLMASKLPYARRLAVLDAQHANALAAVRAVDANLAARGALGAEQYVGRTVIDRQIFDSVTGTFVKSTGELSRSRAAFTAKALGLAKGAKHAAATEAVMAVTLNQNGFLYDDSAAHNIAWMGLGLGMGGAVGWLHSAYQIRKFVNSDEIRRTFANALDPGADEEARLLWHGKKVKPDEQVSFLGGLFSDRVTNLLVGARTLTESAVEGSVDSLHLQANRSAVATQWVQLGQEEAQKLTQRGISSNGRTRFSLDAPGYGNHLKMMLHRDPAAMYGTEQIGGISDDMSIHAVNEVHVSRIQERIDEVDEEIGKMLDDDGGFTDEYDSDKMDKLQRLARRLEFESTLTPMAVIDGELMPLSEAEAFTGFVEPKIRFNPDTPKVKGTVKGTATKDNHGLLSIETENPAGSVTLDTSFIYHIPGKKNSLDSADHFDIMRLYRLGNAAIDRMRRMNGPIVLPNRPDWFQLDMAEELLRRTDGRANVVFPSGMTRESARVEALIQKSRAIKKWGKAEGIKAMREESKGNTYEGQLSKLRLRYNLPKLTAYERGILGDAEHPVEQLLRGMGNLSEDEIRAMNINDVRRSIAEFKRVGDMAPVQKSDINDTGNSFAFMMDENGNPVKPLIAYKRPFKVAEWTTEHNAERLAAAKMWSVQRLTEEVAAPMTRSIAASIVSSPDFDAAARTHELMDTQIQGGLVGASPQSQAGAFGKALTSADWRDRDNPILLAATRLRENVNRQARDFMKAQIDGAFEGQLALLANPRNAKTKLLLNQFHSFRAGWDIATEPHLRDDGFFTFILKNTKDNQERFRQQFGRDMDKAQALLGPNGKEVVLDELGMDIQSRFNQVTESIRREKNTLLRANGRKEIKSLDWYVPPPNTDGKFIGFTFGPDNTPIPGMTVVATTEAEFKQGRDAILKKIEEMGLGYTFRTQESIREFANIWDRVQMDFINPGTTAIQPGKSSKGRLAGNVLRTDAFQESLKYLQDDFLRHSTDIVETLMREQINSAKARGLVSSEMIKNRAPKFYDSKARNVYDYYLENLLGRSRINPKGSFIGRLYGSIEGPLDKFLSESTPSAARVWQATNEWLNKSKLWDKDAQSRKDFEALSQQLGKYMPFESAGEMAERMGLGATPPTVQAITGKLNQFAAAMVLRIGEVIHPVMNLTGILNASPAVIRQFTPQRGETVADFARRVGHSATIFDLGDGRAYGALDITKVAGRTFKDAWNRLSHEDYDYMVRRGFLNQEVAEFQRQFSAIDSPSRWKSFFVGDHNAKGFHNKGVVGWLSVLSDKSEDFSRSWGHMIGLDLADNLGIKGLEARHAFAHDVANKMIANYSPHNRPEIFQGALGAPLGLFQSFLFNYYERLFRYVETKDYKAFAQQMATQAGFFGVTGLPGWQQFNSFMTKESGEDDPSSSIWRRFGGNAGDLLGHGLVSHLPALFGAPSADVYSRGDVSIRQFSIQDTDSISGILNSTTPAFNVLQKLYGGITQGIKLFSDKNPDLSTTQVGEVLSNMIANRPISGMIEQFMAHGNDTDGYGQLVNETHGAMESAYRLIGIRSMRQSRELEAFYANKNAQSHQAALKEDLSRFTRSMIRDGNYEALPQVFEQYVKNGGDPRNFRRWMKQTYIAATSTRGQRMMEKVAKDPAKMEQLLRLLDAGVGVGEDEAVPENVYVEDPQSNQLTNAADF